MWLRWKSAGRHGNGESMIEVKNLEKSFGNIKAIDRVNATIEEGHVFGLIGTNVPRYILKA